MTGRLLFISSGPVAAAPGRRGSELIITDLAGLELSRAVISGAEDLLSSLVSFLEAAKIGLREISGIGIISNSGTFSEIRDRAVLANTLSFGRGIPVAETGSVCGRATGAELLECAARQLTSARLTRSAAVPSYGGEPNITYPKDA